MLATKIFSGIRDSSKVFLINFFQFSCLAKFQILVKSFLYTFYLSLLPIMFLPVFRSVECWIQYKFNHIMYSAPKKRKSYSQKIDFEISKKTCSFIPSTKKYRNMGPSTMSITFIVLFPEARRYVGRYVPTATLP